MDAKRLKQLAGVPLMENTEERPPAFFLHAIGIADGEDLGYIGPFPSRGHAVQFAKEAKKHSQEIRYEDGTVLTPEEFMQTFEDPGLM